jgi:ribosomal protein S1
VRTGVVCNIVDFGAFVDLGGVDGLLHVSELDWRRVSHPSDVLSVGDEVEVYILSVDPERGRIGLSRRRLLPDPWPVGTERLREGQIIEGTVTGAVDGGVYVDLGSGVQGLLRLSDISRGDEARAGLEPGSSIRVRVLHVDEMGRRVSLGLPPVTTVKPWSRVVSLWREVLDLVANRRRADRIGQKSR